MGLNEQHFRRIMIAVQSIPRLIDPTRRPNINTINFESVGDALGDAECECI
jgi:hypothetical protein